jgi:hypothetical protein
MRVSHKPTAVFDDPNLISVAGLAPVMALAKRAGLHELVAEHVTVPGSPGCNAGQDPGASRRVVAGADSISDLDMLRHGGMGRLFDGLRAPTTLGTFLRASAIALNATARTVPGRRLQKVVALAQKHEARRGHLLTRGPGDRGLRAHPEVRAHVRPAPPGGGR